MLDTVRAIAPRVRAASPLTESKRRLPEDIFQSLAEIGVFKAFLPRSLGNSSATLSDLGPVIEEIARADGSAGWLAYVGSEALRHTLLLSQPVAARITESPNAFIAGMFTPGESRAKAVTGGYRVAAKVDARTARGEATSSARRDAFLMAAYRGAPVGGRS